MGLGQHYAWNWKSRETFEKREFWTGRVPAQRPIPVIDRYPPTISGPHIIAIHPAAAR
jgi:hypothetical protein